MEALKIERTESTPEVTMDKTAGIFEIKGNSLPENAFGFYGPVHEWLKSYFEGGANPQTEINLRLDYLNTASSKMIMEIIKLANLHVKKGGDAKIVWHYLEGDDDSLDMGKDFSSVVIVPFSYKVFF